jgi:lysophospholipase L1-like esterase
MKRYSLLSALIVLFMYVFPPLPAQQNEIQDPDPQRFREEIDNFTEWDAKNSFQSQTILFVGSSSIRMWQSHLAFPKFPVINRGFGGAHISDVIYYYDQVIGKYHPALIIFYAGDNDIADGKSVEQVFADYRSLINLMEEENPKAKFVYLPIKPSISRWYYWDAMKNLNKQIEAFNAKKSTLFYLDTAVSLLDDTGKPDRHFFLDDGLHLNLVGYSRWNSLMLPLLEKLYKNGK